MQRTLCVKNVDLSFAASLLNKSICTQINNIQIIDNSSLSNIT